MTTPTASYIGDVEFVPLSASEILKISVKRIHRLPTFDEYQQPVPEGLHDVALGAVLDKKCSTCHLRAPFCKGHPGHIELPLACYHTAFLDVILRLLKSSCLFCHRLRVSRRVLHLFVCKLKVLQYGIVDKLLELDAIGKKHKKGTSGMTNGAADDAASDEAVEDNELEEEAAEESEDDDDDEVFQKREKIVRTSIKKAKKIAPSARQSQVALTERRATIKHFFTSQVIRRACPVCQGLSPGFKKDSSKIVYRNPLPEKQAIANRQRGLTLQNPLVFKQKLEENRTKVKVESQQTLTNGFHDSDTEMEDAIADESHGAEEEMAKIAAEEEADYDDGCTALHRLTAVEVRAALDLLFSKEQEILSLIYNVSPGRAESSADMFFLTHIMVPPNKFRSPIVQGETLTQAAPNTALTNILQASDRIRDIERESRDLSSDRRPVRRDELFMAALALQKAVTSVFDFKSGPNSSEQQVGIKQRLERKEGLFRMNMMGKRVNFAARSVISPDPNIETNEIGVPLVFARKLTYPEPVTVHNFFEMKQAVINGPSKYPGAAAVENEDGQVLNLKFKSLESRIAIANQLMSASPGMTSEANKKVYRHLQTGDVVIMNRQPTLHKPSMMGHRARVLTNEKTIRMHYTNCNTYNADFDGDEMNMHFAQDEVARTEALQIADTDHQYLSSTAGKPLRGLIQDHISMGVHLTSRDTFFDREEYQQLLYNCLRPENYHTVTETIQMLPPAILKPKALWTGKQVISTVIKNITPQNRNGINLNSRSSTAGDRWGPKSEEGEVIFRDGELLCGIIDKAQIGPTSDGLIHSIHELYGHISAGKLLSVIGRLLTRFLNMRAWSCGMEDLYLTKEGDKDRRDTLSKAAKVGRQTASTFVTLDEASSLKELNSRLEDVLRDSEKHVNLDRLYNARTAELSSEVTKACLPKGLWKPFPANQMQTMTTSGAKGSVVNANLISCNLGQQVLEGRRVPVMVSGKTLPSFKAFETDPTAGGYVQGRFLTGIKPQEYFFHAMAGREGLIDTAVKTATSGYLQRCIVKGLEGMRTEYDYSVRDTSNGAIIQFLYGEDGLDVVKQKHLTQFGFLAKNQLSVKASTNIMDHNAKFQDTPDFEAAQQYRKESMKRVKKSGRFDAMDPVMAVFNPGSNLGSTSEAFQDSLAKYIELNPDKAIKNAKKGIVDDVITKKTFQRMMELKYMKSLVDPGEAVGVVAAQSVGEPSTQMTLNTFHLAGHSAKNVTLGIPRLREIVMTGSKAIKTPAMTLQMVGELSKEEGESFAKGISRLSLAALIDEVSVKERSGSTAGHKRARLYDVGLTFFPSDDYSDEYGVSTEDVLGCLKDKFVKILLRLIKKTFARKAKERAKTEVTSAVPDVGKSVGTVAMARAEAANNGDDADSDFDADDARQARGQNEEYDDPESGDDAESSDSSSDDEVSPPQVNGETEDGETVNGTEKDKDDEAGAKDDQDVIGDNQQVTSFKFFASGTKCTLTLAYDVSTAKILLLPLIEKGLGMAVIQHIPGIGSCLFVEDKKNNPATGQEEIESSVMTDGVNLAAMGEYQDIIYPHSVYTNSVFHMLEFYGVEAARNTIIREVDSVFKGHSISVDNRHLNLIADAMTHDGGYKAFSRHGMIQNQGSILAKMSFETVFGFMKEAVLDGAGDSLFGPSAKLVIGTRGSVGTGSFDVIVPVGGKLLGGETNGV